MGLIKVALFTKDGELVTQVPFLPYNVAPDAIMWGSRFFILRSDGKYYEGHCHFVIPPPGAIKP